MHGLELMIEAVRQLRGTVDQPGAGRATSRMVTSGPMVTPVSEHASSASEATL